MCKHIVKVGKYAAEVKPGCRGETHMIKGMLVVAKYRCADCPHREEEADETDLRRLQSVR